MWLLSSQESPPKPNVFKYNASSTCWEGDASRTLWSSAFQATHGITEESPHPFTYKVYATRPFARPTWQSTNQTFGGLAICFTEMDSSILLTVLVGCLLFLGYQRRDLLLPVYQARVIVSVPAMHTPAFWSSPVETAYLLEVDSLAASNQRIIAESCIH